MRAITIALLTSMLGNARALRTSGHTHLARGEPVPEPAPSAEAAPVVETAPAVEAVAEKATPTQIARVADEDKAKPAPTDDSAAASPVFYTVIMGRLAFRHQVSLWLSSLRIVGKWTGEAVIVSDRPVCLAKTLSEAKLIGEKLSSDAHVDIYAPGAGYTGNLHIVKRPLARSINKMKLEKARGWLNVNVASVPHRVSSIIYTDEDIVMAKPVQNFVRVIQGLEKEKHTLALFRDTGKSAGELHTGIVAMFPGQGTDACLQAWGKKLTGIEIGSHQESAELKVTSVDDISEDTLMAEEILAMGPDQQALGKTKECKKAKDGSHEGVRILPAPFFWLPTPGGLKKGKVAEFVHFTNTGRWKLISHAAIKAWAVQIGIPEHIDPMGSVHDKECAIPEGGTLADVVKGPKNYGR